MAASPDDNGRAVKKWLSLALRVDIERMRAQCFLIVEDDIVRSRSF